MENAPYHSVQLEKFPNKSWRNNDIQAWLDAKGLKWNGDMSKLELLQVAEPLRGTVNEYSVDKIASDAGHKVVRLPPYHCELNPIEEVLAFVKGYIAANNKNFKIIAVQSLTQ